MRRILVGVLMGCAATAAQADDGQPRYEIRPGNLSGLPSTASDPTPPVTILLDHRTGRTWFLAVIDGTVRWQALPFGKAATAEVLPPVVGDDAADDELRGGGDGVYKR